MIPMFHSFYATVPHKNRDEYYSSSTICLWLSIYRTRMEIRFILSFSPFSPRGVRAASARQSMFLNQVDVL